ncbi:MAG: tRNA (cytidine(34)-2'-O)-methyltransferase [Erysipelothrix sp.]|nr:tRNA (cytidine(34)-2'-O)-methyltransferase [Erysipelothrix sp.]
MINIVLYAPEIPSNTGNIMRTSMASNTRLILIKPLGFELSDKQLKRSGLDYLKDTNYIIYDNFSDFEANHPGSYYLISRYGKKTYSDETYKSDEDIYLIFGNESSGLHPDILRKYKEKAVRIPMVANARSLNLANSVALVVYEALRQTGFSNLSLTEQIKGADFIDKVTE